MTSAKVSIVCLHSRVEKRKSEQLKLQPWQRMTEQAQKAASKMIVK